MTGLTASSSSLQREFTCRRSCALCTAAATARRLASRLTLPCPRRRLFVAPFITDLAKANGESDPRAFYSFVQSASTIASILAYVLLSGLGEFGGTKNTLARIAALTGGVCTTLFFCVVVPEMVWVAAVLFIVARVASRITGLMMDALLSEVSHHDDWVAHNVSAKAVTLGYTGMIAFVILVAPIVVLPTFLGMDSGSDTRQWLEQRIPLGLCGVWWTAFALVAFAWLDKYPGKPFPPEAGHGSKAQQVCWTTRMGMLEQWSAIKTMLSFPDVGRFLLAWMFLSDASSTATSMAVLVASAIGLSVVQQGVAAIIGLVTAALGMTGFRFLVKVGVLTPFWALQVNICVLAVMLVFVPFLRSAWEVYLLTAVGGVNVGSIASFTRSMLATMIPKGLQSNFFAVYELTQKGTSWIGPLAIGAVTAALKDNSSSTFVLITVIVIFVEIAIGAPIFCCVNVKRGQELAASYSSDGASTDTENPVATHSPSPLDTSSEQRKPSRRSRCGIESASDPSSRGNSLSSTVGGSHHTGQTQQGTASDVGRASSVSTAAHIEMSATSGPLPIPKSSRGGSTGTMHRPAEAKLTSSTATQLSASAPVAPPHEAMGDGGSGNPAPAAIPRHVSSASIYNRGSLSAPPGRAQSVGGAHARSGTTSQPGAASAPATPRSLGAGVDPHALRSALHAAGGSRRRPFAAEPRASITAPDDTEELYPSAQTSRAQSLPAAPSTLAARAALDSSDGPRTSRDVGAAAVHVHASPLNSHE